MIRTRNECGTRLRDCVNIRRQKSILFHPLSDLQLGRQPCANRCGFGSRSGSPQAEFPKINIQAGHVARFPQIAVIQTLPTPSSAYPFWEKSKKTQLPTSIFIFVAPDAVAIGTVASLLANSAQLINSETESSATWRIFILFVRYLIFIFSVSFRASLGKAFFEISWCRQGFQTNALHAWLRKASVGHGRAEEIAVGAASRDDLSTRQGGWINWAEGRGCQIADFRLYLHRSLPQVNFRVGFYWT